MIYETERYHVAASIEGVGIVWEETLAACDVDSMVAALRSNDPARNVIAENGHDLTRLTITVRALPLSEFDRLCQEAKAADAAEAAERAERVARGIAAAEADLAALGIECAIRDDSSWATVYRGDVILGTVQRPNRILRERHWTFCTPDGALVFKAPGRLTTLRQLVKRFA